MLHAYVQKFDAMGTLEIFFETKHGKRVIWLKLIGKKNASLILLASGSTHPPRAQQQQPPVRVQTNHVLIIDGHSGRPARP